MEVSCYIHKSAASSLRKETLVPSEAKNWLVLEPVWAIYGTEKKNLLALSGI
jgi:hypothetical protein